MTLCVSAIVMWWRRRPEGSLGVPAPKVPDFRIGPALKFAMVALAIALPVLGISILVLWITHHIASLFSSNKAAT
jgi:uncharacterized iron-regulated membrane protein